MFPSCISFVEATLHAKKYCFISHSSSFEMIESNILLEFIEEMNHKRKDVEFVLVNQNASRYFHEVLRVFNNEFVTRACAEIYYVKLLAKLWLENGLALQVHGVSNFSFYPFNLNENYGYHSLDPVNKMVRPLVITKKLMLDNDRYTVPIACCTLCQQNKNAVARILKGAQEYRERYEYKKSKNKELRRKLELSPVRYSIKSKSSLFSENESGVSNADSLTAPLGSLSSSKTRHPT